MATIYSDHYSATAGSTSIDDPRIKVAPGLSHSKIHRKRASVTAPAAITDDDILRFFTLKTNDRPIELFLSTPSLTGTGMTAACGVYKTTENGGAVVDIDLFGAVGNAPLNDLTVAIARVDLFKIAALEDEDRGKKLYELVDEGLGSALYDNDPVEEWDIAITMDTENAVTAGAEIILECYYTSSGS